MQDKHAHSRIINKLSREALSPLGVIQKGRSRTWLDDQGWWLIVIEFQPSGWDRGTYLNVGAMWLWYAKAYFSFDVGYRVGNFIKYESDDRFELAIEPMITFSVQKVIELRGKFSSVDKVARYYKRMRRKNFWDLYYGGIACGIAGDASNTVKLLSKCISIDDERDWLKSAQSVARRFHAIAHSQERFKAEAAREVEKARQLLKLKELPAIWW